MTEKKLLKAKGKIAQSSIRLDTVEIRGQNIDKTWFKLENDERSFSLLGTFPWKEGQEVEFEFEENVRGDKVYRNVKLPKTGRNAGSNSIPEIIKALTMPKISVGFEKTVQENQYEPKKVSVHLSMVAEDVDQKKIRELLNAAEAETIAKIGGSAAEKPANSVGKAKELVPSKAGPSRIDKMMDDGK